MLAVVGQYVVAVFANAGEGAADNLLAIEEDRVFVLYPHRTPAAEFRERHLFNGAGPQSAPETGILNNLPSTHVDSVMGVTSTWRSQMGAHWWILTNTQRLVASAGRVACAVVYDIVGQECVHAQGTCRSRTNSKVWKELGWRGLCAPAPQPAVVLAAKAYAARSGLRRVGSIGYGFMAHGLTLVTWGAGPWSLDAMRSRPA